VISPATVIEQARSWLGVRFLHQGRTRSGADCLGYIAGMMAELGTDVPLKALPLNYARNPQARLVQTLEEITHEIPLQPAAFVLIKFPKSHHGSHGAIYTGENLIHSYQSVGRVVEHGYRMQWVRWTVSVWALPLVTYE
jgi:cell wall-associated NlpC family hydrolase